MRVLGRRRSQELFARGADRARSSARPGIPARVRPANRSRPAQPLRRTDHWRSPLRSRFAVADSTAQPRGTGSREGPGMGGAEHANHYPASHVHIVTLSPGIVHRATTRPHPLRATVGPLRDRRERVRPRHRRGRSLLTDDRGRRSSQRWSRRTRRVSHPSQSLCEMGDHGLDLRVAVERLEALLAAVA